MTSKDVGVSSANKALFFGSDNFDAGDNSIEKGSLRSSEADDFEEDEKFRLERKIEMTRDRLKRVVLAREADVEEYIRMSGGLKSQDGQENAQQIRIRQHFEKKNKKHSQETDQLQKKLEQLQSRLQRELGDSAAMESQKTVLSNVGQGLKGMGANLKGTITATTGGVFGGIRGGLSGLSTASQNAAGSVISVPRDLASKLKRKFGSADNLSAVVDSQTAKSQIGEIVDGSRTINATNYYTDVETNSDRAARAFSNGPEPLSSSIAQDPRFARRLQSIDAGNSNFVAVYNEIREELRQLRTRQDEAVQSIDSLKTQMQSEYSYYHNVLHEERFRFQRLEEQLNDTIELHQAEIVNLKTDMQNLANRMEYQYMDKFRDLQEIVEASQNKVSQLEQKMEMESAAKTGPTSLNSLMISGANLLIESLKLILFFFSVLLDLFKPVTGSRTRAGMFLTGIILFIVTFNYFNLWTAIVRILPTRTATVPKSP